MGEGENNKILNGLIINLMSKTLDKVKVEKSECEISYRS